MHPRWWFNDALTLGFSLFVFAAAAGAVLERPFVVQRLSGVGIVLPLIFVALNLTRYVWATRAATGAGVGLALGALRVNMSLSWVIALACLRGLTQERGVFLRTPKFEGAAAVRELRLVWVETGIAAVSLILLVAVIVAGGRAPLSLALIGLLAWSLLIYGSATINALADPTRRPLSAALRQKALLELRPGIGRVARARSTRAAIAMSLAAAMLMLAVASEGGRPPAADLPFTEPLGPTAVDGGDLLTEPRRRQPESSTPPRPTASPTSLELVDASRDDPVSAATPNPLPDEVSAAAESAATPAPAAPVAEPAPPTPAPTVAEAAPAPPAPAPTPAPAEPPGEQPTPPPAEPPGEQPTPPVAAPTPPPTGRP